MPGEVESQRTVYPNNYNCNGSLIGRNVQFQVPVMPSEVQQESTVMQRKEKPQGTVSPTHRHSLMPTQPQHDGTATPGESLSDCNNLPPYGKHNTIKKTSPNDDALHPIDTHHKPHGCGAHIVGTRAPNSSTAQHNTRHQLHNTKPSMHQLNEGGCNVALHPIDTHHKPHGCGAHTVGTQASNSTTAQHNTRHQLHNTKPSMHQLNEGGCNVALHPIHAHHKPHGCGAHTVGTQASNSTTAQHNTKPSMRQLNEGGRNVASSNTTYLMKTDEEHYIENIKYLMRQNEVINSVEERPGTRSVSSQVDSHFLLIKCSKVIREVVNNLLASEKRECVVTLTAEGLDFSIAKKKEKRMKLPNKKENVIPIIRKSTFCM